MAPMVSLPSISEGFPDIDFKDTPLPAPYSLQRSPPSKHDYVTAPPYPRSRGRSGSHYSSPGPYDRPTSANYSSPRANPIHSYRPKLDHHSSSYHDGGVARSPQHYSRPSPRGLQHPPPPPPPPLSMHRPEQPGNPHLTPSSSSSSDGATAHPAEGSTFSGGATHSFDVLRSEPGTVSLEHIASSKTLSNRGTTTSKPVSPTGIANGSAPAFRVVLPSPSSAHREASSPPPPPPPQQQQQQQQQTFSQPPQGYTQSVNRVVDARRVESSAVAAPGPNPSSSIVSFSMSEGSSVSKLTVDDHGRSHFEEIGSTSFRVDGRGKKHQCPQCSKRFNRPSSLRIHVNTHTGARPFQCPHPGCGREFNVNSNMRRHYRNHSLAATAEVHPPRHNSGRRPRGFTRPHPGHPSTSVFHVNSESRGSALSAGSPSSGSAQLSDEDYDMDREEYDSGFDEVEEEGSKDSPNESRSRYSVWSRSPSPPQHYPHSLGYAYSQSRAEELPRHMRPRTPPSQYAAQSDSLSSHRNSLRPTFRT